MVKAKNNVSSGKFTTFQIADLSPEGKSLISIVSEFKDSVNTPLFNLNYVPQSDYFKTYRFQAAGGPSIAEIDSMGFQKQKIMTEGAFDDGPVLGRSFKSGETRTPIIATVQPIKMRSDIAPQQVMFSQVHPEEANIVFRLRKDIDVDDFLAVFRPWAQKTLCGGNVFTQSVTTYKNYVKESTVYMDYDYRINMILMSFFLFCLFFGVSGAFWMQTRSRCEEIGIMKSFGATSGKVIRLFLTEAGFS